jgi:hypothetical protein
MRKFLAVGLAVGLTLALAGPASAGKVSVNAARNIVRYDASDLAYVIVDDYADYEVETYGATIGNAVGWAWFTVRVEGVGSGPLSAKAFGTGDCTGRTISVKRRAGGVAIVKVRHSGDFDCTYKSVTVRWP